MAGKFEKDPAGPSKFEKDPTGPSYEKGGLPSPFEKRKWRKTADENAQAGKNKCTRKICMFQGSFKRRAGRIAQHIHVSSVHKPYTPTPARTCKVGLAPASTRRGKRNQNILNKKVRKLNLWRKLGREKWRSMSQADAKEVRLTAASVLQNTAAQKATTASLDKQVYRENQSNAKYFFKHISKSTGASKTCLIKHFQKERRRSLRKKAQRINRKLFPKPKSNRQYNKGRCPLKLDYARKVKIATLNCRGLAELSKRQQLIHAMKKLHIDILALQETKIKTDSTETHDGYAFFFGSQSVQNDRRQRTEHHGVGFVISPYMNPFLLDCTPISDRLIEITIAARGRNLTIINGYAPHSGRPPEEKDQFWNCVADRCDAHPQSSPTLVVGDLNARIHGRQFPETDIMGPYIFGNGSSFIQELPLDQLNNRQRLIDFCKYHGYSIASTYFSKAPQKQCTFKFSTTQGFNSPWTPERFAQLDHILCAKRWRNCIIDVESRPDIAFDSDHAFLTATVRIKLNQQKQRVPNKVDRYRTPTDPEKRAFNAHIRSNYRYLTSLDSLEFNNNFFQTPSKELQTHALLKFHQYRRNITSRKRHGL